MPLIRGRIVDASGNPAADARVMVTGGPAPVPDVALLAGADGVFAVAVPVAGHWQLLAVSDSGRAVCAIDVAAGVDAVDLTLRLKPD